MGQRNKEKRAAKKRRRGKHGPTQRGAPNASRDLHGPGCTCGNSGPFGESTNEFRSDAAPPSADTLAVVLLEAGQEQASGNSFGAVPFVSELSDDDASYHERVLGTAAAIALNRVVTALWERGWLPADLCEIVRRRSDARAQGLLVDAIAADTAQHAPATVHVRWTDQVQGADATVWWQASEPHLGQWTRRHGVSMRQALSVTITLIAELVLLPKLPRILPPPGATPQRVNAAGASVDQKVLARVRRLLAKAESTEFPAEAEALSAKAQEMMNRYAFERALVDADDDVQQTATSIRLWLDNPYVEAKSHLVAAIADANRCRSVFYSKLGFVALVGEAMDLEITELLTTSLLVQATHAMIAEGSHVTGGGTSRTRSFRRSFLVSYANRIGERLTEAADHARDPDEDARLLPVLAARSKVVEDTFNEMFEHIVQKTVSVSNGAGWHAGRAAADRADLGVERGQIQN